MEKNKLKYFEQKLINEKNEIIDTIDSVKESVRLNSSGSEGGEISMVDNHPADNATEMTDKQRSIALMDNEKNILRMIDDSLEKIKNDKYGLCEICGKKIDEERLNMIPYTSTCIECENSKVSRGEFRPPEEDVLSYPFGRSFRDNFDENEYYGEDAWQDVDSFNKRKGNERNYDDDKIATDDIENISNQQYKNQLS